MLGGARVSFLAEILPKALRACTLPAWALAFLAALGTSNSALAWDPKGHEVVAKIAESYLTPTTKAAVSSLLDKDTDTLPGRSIVDAATWADKYSQIHPKTEQWHFVNLQIDQSNNLGEACFGWPRSNVLSPELKNDCIVNKLEIFSNVLKDKNASEIKRVSALKFIIHLMADLHQPLHVADNHDKGGNCVLVDAGVGRALTLHEYWDGTVVDRLGPDANSIAERLKKEITQGERWATEKSEYRTWAFAAFADALLHAYAPPLNVGCTTDRVAYILDEKYLRNSDQIASNLLRKAGLRLAFVLNRALDEEFAAWNTLLEREGVAYLLCTVKDEGTMDQCRVIAEYPVGRGFGDRAMGMAPSFKMRPRNKANLSDPTEPKGRVVIPVGFDLEN